LTFNATAPVQSARERAEGTLELLNPGETGRGSATVRKNIGGTLYAQSYGKATHVAIERIETEALFHYRPGDRILSLGNIGCNLDCDYCQNWMYSQFQYTAPEHIHRYSTEEVISRAVANGVNVLSWTYNDPAVWFEFVVDTAREARKRGLLNLFKSAFFLTREAVEQLCDVIDVFAISQPGRHRRGVPDVRVPEFKIDDRAYYPTESFFVD
jgi:pyruvate formate lyase activating enzyme